MIAKGIFDGQIKAAECAVDKDGHLVMLFKLVVATEDGTVEGEARHTTVGEYAWIAEKVAEVVGIEWPDGLANIASCVGKDVPVQIKHNEYKGQTYVNFYISVGRSNQTATPEQVAAGVAKLSAEKSAKDDDDCPFPG